MRTPHHRAEMPLAEVGLFAGFSATELTIIVSRLKRVSYHAGAVVFREGDHGNEVLIVTKGIASAYLQMPNSNIRVATFAPGTIIGELAILDEGARSATVIADEELVCFGLTRSSLDALVSMSPSVAIRLLAAIGRELSGRLRAANRTIHQLET
jgi:CRP-like cAMP-binding protein